MIHIQLVYFVITESAVYTSYFTMKYAKALQHFISGRSNISIACESGKIVKVDGEIKNIKQLSCVKNVAADIFATNMSYTSHTSGFLSVG